MRGRIALPSKLIPEGISFHQLALTKLLNDEVISACNVLKSTSSSNALAMFSSGIFCIANKASRLADIVAEIDHAQQQVHGQNTLGAQVK